MTVKQWIEMLKEYPEEREVMIRTADELFWYNGVHIKLLPILEQEDDITIILTEAQD